MGLAPFLMSRDLYEAVKRERECEAPDATLESVESRLDRWYPVTTGEAAHELDVRGIDANVDTLVAHARAAGVTLRQIGRNHVWYADDIDRVAESLAHAGRLTRDALWRRSHGMSCAEQVRIQREFRQRREAALRSVAAECSRTLPDVWDAVANVMPDPVDWSEADFAEAARRVRASRKGAKR